MRLHYHPCNAKACEPSGTSVADLVAEERERIVAWLRAEAEREWGSGLIGSHYIGNSLDMSADDIECGAHLEEK